MSTKRFIIKTTVRLMILIVIFTIVSVYTHGMLNTITNNELALGQMENSTEAFVLMETYNGMLKPLVTIGASLSTILIVIATIYDTYKFLKYKGEKTK